MNQKNFNLWEGVYKTWNDAPGDDGVFNDDIWKDEMNTIFGFEFFRFARVRFIFFHDP